jgi:biotin operon repressor
VGRDTAENEGHFMQKATIDRILVARRLYMLARQSHAEASDAGQFCAVLLLQDAVEVFVLAAAIETGATVKEKAEFAQLLEDLSRHNGGYQVPKRTQLVRLNRIRVSAKHHAIHPLAADVAESLDAVFEAFCSISSDLLKCDFKTVSVMDSIDASEEKNYLQSALDAWWSRHDAFLAAVEVRKAVYECFESSYDISSFARGTQQVWTQYVCEAPPFARTPEFIETHVVKPTDQIQIDRTGIEQKLLKAGIDTASFWNLVSLTPAVYRNASGTWLAHWDLDLMSRSAMEGHVQYLLDTGVQILAAVHAQRRRFRQRQAHAAEIVVNAGPVHLYRTASTAQSLGEIPAEIRRLNVFGFTSGFDADSYWHVWYPIGDSYAAGFVSAHDVESTNAFDPRPL